MFPRGGRNNSPIFAVFVVGARRDREAKLRDTRRNCDRMLAAMQDESARIEMGVDRLIQDLSAAIAGADRFIQTMADGPAC